MAGGFRIACDGLSFFDLPSLQSGIAKPREFEADRLKRRCRFFESASANMLSLASKFLKT
jgi:hypothetical protein